MGGIFGEKGVFPKKGTLGPVGHKLPPPGIPLGEHDEMDPDLHWGSALTLPAEDAADIMQGLKQKQLEQRATKLIIDSVNDSTNS